MADMQKDCCAMARSGRLAAGHDPAKRAQILAGARNVISRMGYDAASVNDIAREAGVSKGTIYVYFNGKDELFEALMEQAREGLFLELEELLGLPGSLRERMMRYGETVAKLLCSDEGVRVHRVMFGVAERMPEIGARFYERGATRGSGILAGVLKPEVQAGRLDIAEEDLPFAAKQFFELCLVGLFRRRLFGHMEVEPTSEEITRVVTAAADMFLARYGTELLEG